MPDDVSVTDAVLDAAREAGRRKGLAAAKGECETRASAVRRANTRGGQLTAVGHFGVGIALSCADDICALIPAAPAPMEATTDLPDHEAVQGILGDPPHVTSSQALDGAGCALEMCAAAVNAELAFPNALAKAAIIAYLSLTGRDAEAEKVSHVDV